MPFGSSLITPQNPSPSSLLKRDLSAELRAAAFRAYASLGSNDEDIRRKIIEQHQLMTRVVAGLSDPQIDVRLAATRCLHVRNWEGLGVNCAYLLVCVFLRMYMTVFWYFSFSTQSMSRSVQLLRTSFQDHAVWKPLMKMLHNASDEVLRLASSTLCNLLLEFSPSKEPILESGVVDMLVGLTRREDQVSKLRRRKRMFFSRKVRM